MLDAAACSDLALREIAWIEPAAAFGPFADEPYTAWLDSAKGYGGLGRYSYVAARPFKVMVAGPDNPFPVVAAELSRWRLPAGLGPAPFCGGAIGFFGYGLRRHLEVLADRQRAGGLPDMVLGFYDVVLVFDHLAQRAWICASGFPAMGEARWRRAVERLDEIMALLDGVWPRPMAALPELNWQAEISQEDYKSRVARVLEYVKSGDIFQANFTSRFVTKRPDGVAAADIYLALRAKNPAPFGAYIGCGEGYALCSVSPERFVALDVTGRIETRPIKGTIKRVTDEEQDLIMRQALQTSPKDRAENLMIVDLMRSDIGRVAEIGSVQVEALWQIESHKNLHHLVSAISARLQAGLGAIDLLQAVFPGGSVTGAPKIRAMEIIDELENSARGAYCGAIAWLGFDGAMDSSMIIRTITMTPEQLIAQAGGGIVSDSNPAEEYEEMRLKIAPLLEISGP